MFPPWFAEYYKNISSNTKTKTCECRDLKEIFGELVGWKDPSNPKGKWNPSPNNKPNISFKSLYEHCSWLYLIPFIVFRLIQWVTFLNVNRK